MCAALLVIAFATLASAAEKPYFLVATREMGDPMFQRSVVLIIPGTPHPLVAGIIINQPTGTPARDMFPDSPALKQKSEMAYFGGPVEPSKPTLLLRSPHPGGKVVRIEEDVYATDDRGSIAELLKYPKD